MRLHDDPADNSILKIGDKAPDFILKNETEKDWRLSGQFGNVTALLFYPKNETLVCTRQMCSVRDNWARYLNTKASIVAVSPGTTEDHLNFSRRHRLPIPILADADRSITKIYCEHWLFPIRFVRAVVVIDARGFIRCRQVMLRAFRPIDSSVIRSIMEARTEFTYEHFDHILNQSREKNKHFL